MDKRLILVSALILLISFSAGIFTEIVSPAGELAVSTQLPSVGASFLDYIENDFITVLAAMIFSACVFLLPLVPLIIIGKTFSLGFTAAYILSSLSDHAFSIVFAVLLPRGIFKLPAYVALTLVAADFATFIKKNYQNSSALRKGIKTHLIRFGCCFCGLAISSLLEVLLLQGVL